MTSKNEKKNSKITTDQIKDTSPWTERIGVYFIGLMTTLGLVLITYTGVRAAIYNPVVEAPELLTHDDIVLNTDFGNLEEEDDSLDSDDAVSDIEDTDEAESDADEDIDVVEDEENNEEDELNEDNSLPISFIGAAIADMVFVREEPRSGETSPIHTYLSEGDEIKVINSAYNENWMQVEVDGIIAYVGKGLLVPVE